MASINFAVAMKIAEKSVDKAVGYFNSRALLNANHRYSRDEKFNPSEGKQIYTAAKKELDEVGKYAKSPEQMQRYQKVAKQLEDSANRGMTAYLLEAKSVLAQAREMIAEGDKKLGWKSQHPTESRGLNQDTRAGQDYQFAKHFMAQGEAAIDQAKTFSGYANVLPPSGELERMAIALRAELEKRKQ